MANNTTIDMKDGYIIFGIEDKTYNIIGVGDDSNRKNTENIIGFLSSQIWSGEEVPNISVTTVEVDGKEIDILTIKIVIRHHIIYLKTIQNVIQIKRKSSCKSRCNL